MKKQKLPLKKLSLSKETIVHLLEKEQAHIAGGAPVTQGLKCASVGIACTVTFGPCCLSNRPICTSLACD